MSEVVSFADKLARAKQKLPTPPVAPSAPVAPTAPTVTFMADERSANDQLIDQAVDSLDIVEAYNRYVHKGTVQPNGRTEGIKVRCPNPAHPDNNPSAWLNTDKGTWYCGSCAEGGDKYDFAAWHHGAPVPGYKVGSAFHDLRRKIAADQGYVVQRLVGGTEVVVPPAPPEVGPGGLRHESAPLVDPSLAEGHGELAGVGAADLRGVEAGRPDGSASVTKLPSAINVLEEVESIQLAWKPIIASMPNTFLETWMRQTTIDDVPEEYHFINGLLAISMALGRDVTLQDFRPVYGNLFVVILGKTGSGKSKAKYYLDTLLEIAAKYKADDPFSKGVLRMNGIASAEALIWMFKKEIEDPSTKKKDLFPVRGLIDYNELSQLTGRGGRAGNVLMPTMMQFYDMEKTVETVSRTHGVERAEEPYACAITTSQPKALRGLVSSQDAASGFLNRWFFAAGKEKTRQPIGGVIVDVSPAVPKFKEIQAWASSAGSLPWSQEANDKFSDFFHRELEPVRRNDETDLLNRIDLLCKKLVLLFTANMRDREVRPEAVEQMMMLYPYILECYGVPGAHIGSSLQNEIRENILRIVVDHYAKTGKGASNRDLTQRLKRKNYPLDLYNRTLKYMIEIEEIIVMPAAQGAGRPTTRYGVHDLDEAKAIVFKTAARPETEAEAK